MAKKQHSFGHIIISIVGVLVALAVGFGMIDKVLTVRYIPLIITVIAGWIVVIGTIIGIILGLAKHCSK